MYTVLSTSKVQYYQGAQMLAITCRIILYLFKYLSCEVWTQSHGSAYRRILYLQHPVKHIILWSQIASWGKQSYEVRH